MYLFTGFILAVIFVLVNVYVVKSKILEKVIPDLKTMSEQDFTHFKLFIAGVTAVVFFLGWPVFLWINLLLLVILFIIYKL